MKGVLFLTVIIFVQFINGCSNSPSPINYGEDNCEYCLMLITDPKYGSELMTDKGKIYKFDSVECLAAYSFKNDPLNNWTKWVTDFYNPNNLINLKSAYFLKSQKLRSPMGLNLSAFSKGDHLQTIRNEFGGTKISWIELAKYVSEEWDEN
ncbi:MAG: hypothetical protein CVV23_07945 [Ignavibacteriae bacterium HGW-Ignavibacteriae-2]|nr:MAG: hypothetical protein CVV23_07945 [Ignavibacteriae bacterium HGW-Ignavibacteriae-2]